MSQSIPTLRSFRVTAKKNCFVFAFYVQAATQDDAFVEVTKKISAAKKMAGTVIVTCQVCGG